MAKQIGALKITGTIADITFYRMEGQYYARRKSSLDGKRVKRDPRFARTMEWAHRLALGSQLASKAYRSLPREKQVYTLYKELKSLAIKRLKEDHSEEAVLLLLQQRAGSIQPTPATRPGSTPPVKSYGKPPVVCRLWLPGQNPCRQKAPARVLRGRTAQKTLRFRYCWIDTTAGVMSIGQQQKRNGKSLTLWL